MIKNQMSLSFSNNIIGDMRNELDSRGTDEQYDADYSYSTYDLLPFRALDKKCYCLAIKFLGFDWQSRFRSIKPSELRVAMILTLLKCPNHACATKHFPAKILHLLKVRTNRSPKEEFSDKVKKQVNWLATKGIIKNYKSTNDRVKLESSYKYFLENSLPHVMKTITTDNDIADNPSAKKELVVEGFEKEEIFDMDDLGTRIPDLPPDVNDSDVVEFENVDTEKRSDEADNDDFIEKLFKDPEKNSNNASHSRKDFAEPGGDFKKGTEILNLFEYIKTEFQDMKDVEIDQSARALAIYFRDGSNIIPLNISYSSLNNELLVKALINCRPEAAVNILRNWPNLLHSAWLCIEKYNGKEFYVVQSKVDLNRFDNENIIDITLNILETAKRIYDISGQIS